MATSHVLFCFLQQAMHAT